MTGERREKNGVRVTVRMKRKMLLFCADILDKSPHHRGIKS